MCWPGIQPSTWVEATSGVTGTGRHGSGHMAHDGTLRNTDSKEPQRGNVSNVKCCGTPSKIRTEKISAGSVMQSEEQDNFRTPLCPLLGQRTAEEHRITLPPSP